ncbi:e3 ubiquitin-protein ligase RNF13 [Trichonephila clavipes]|nr:e3 ubiquitin-protein ligase RNF13 [Trichonephila clavipes]
MLDWRQIWGSGRPRKGSNSAETVLCTLANEGCHNDTLRHDEKSRLNLDSSLKMTWFHSAAVQFPRACTPNRGVDGWVSRAVHVIGTAIPNVLQPGTFEWFEKTQGPLVKVLPVPGLRPMKQLVVRVHF